MRSLDSSLNLQSMRERVMDQLFHRVGGLSGVESVGASTRLPLSYGWTGGVLVEGEDFDPEAQRPMTWFVCAGGDYFDAMGIALSRGRTLRAGDGDEGGMGVVVNRTFAERYWPGEDPLGKRVRGNWSQPGSRRPWSAWWRTCARMAWKARPPGSSTCPSSRPSCRTAGSSFALPETPPPWLLPSAGSSAAIDPQLPLSSVFTGEEIYETSAGSRRFNTLLLALFAAVALFLIAAGAYGVLAFDVVRRRNEIGVRAALGASTRTIVKLVLSRGVRLALLGVAFGLAIATASARFLESLLYEVGPLNPVSLA